MNENIKNLRQEIAKLEKEQKNTKVQRKDVNFHGERTISPYQAVLLVPRQRHTLRLMYAAYGLMRGRKFKDIESQYQPLNRNNVWETYGVSLSQELEGAHPLSMYASEINAILNKYGYSMVYEEKKNTWGQPYKAFKANCDEEIICLSQPEA